MVKWDGIELLQLKYAIAVYDHQGLTRAAEYLNIDKGFLSRKIELLEKKLQFKIFKSKKSPLKLTIAGHEFLQAARQILHQFQQTVELGQRLNRAEKEQLNIGINTSIANSILPEILRAFHQQCPEVELMLYEMASYDQIEKLRHQQIDLGFFHLHNLESIQQNNDNDVLAFKTILKEQLVIVLPENHRLARRASIEVKELRNEQFILPPDHLLHNLRDKINELCAIAGFQPNVRQEAAWISTVVSLVAGGMGISLLPANVQNLQRSGVIYRPLEGLSPILEIVAVWRSNHVSRILSNFLQVLDNLRYIS
ncbi:LysR family transcriptional regulator [Calothrix sp. NIES-2100]|uniref:LysR substrate-binding domain-containing protein n=1 Tax=Calothrix sp. NIES-2100 TaxID=1954172 RepID=UPI000B5F6FF5|nr:LysR family transcriptional regulator [Calothrix sp. NIES-2100]